MRTRVCESAMPGSRECSGPELQNRSCNELVSFINLFVGSFLI